MSMKLEALRALLTRILKLSGSFQVLQKIVSSNIKIKKLPCFVPVEFAVKNLQPEGFENVFHLQGGILKYLEEVKEEESLWEGECFVFDDRVAVKHNLEQGKYDQCHACRFPITEEDTKHPHYEKGASCPRCYGTKNIEQVDRYRERERQVQLAKKRGEVHIGDDANHTQQKT